MVKRSQIRAFSEAVAREFRPQKIVLCGSYAYGKATEDSDVDLLVIMRRSRDHGERMSARIRHAIPPRLSARPAGPDTVGCGQALALGRPVHP